MAGMRRALGGIAGLCLVAACSSSVEILDTADPCGGVCWPAASWRAAPSAAAPGGYYDNRDFNAPGTAYIRLAGEDVFEALDERIAAPLGMQDFAVSNRAARNTGSH